MFSLITFELERRGARPEFANGRATPGHRQVAFLVDKYLTHFSDKRRANLISELIALYSSRLEADYSVKRTDREAVADAFQSARRIARYLGVKL